jgi:hypothetical protein
MTSETTPGCNDAAGIAERRVSSAILARVVGG